VLDTGVLEPVSITLEDAADRNGKMLLINVREKWSIFPVPVFFVSSGQINGGIFFADANAFGLNDKFFIGAMYGADGWMVTTGYMHSAKEGFPGWTLSGSVSQPEHRSAGPNNEDIRRFNLDSIGASAGISYPFMEWLNASLRFSYRQMTLRDSESPLEEPEAGARVLGVNAGLSMRKSRWDGYLLSEKSLSASYTFTAGLGSPSFHEIGLRGVYQEPLLPGFNVNLRGGLLYQPGVPPLFESSPYAAQVNILPANFSARHYAGLSLGLEKHLFKINAGALSAAASYQAVFSEGPILGGRLDHGAAASLVFYLSKLAIPAVGLGLGYNVNSRYLQFSFSLGMGF
jgi:hypothetical protein